MTSDPCWQSFPLLASLQALNRFPQVRFYDRDAGLSRSMDQDAEEACRLAEKQLGLKDIADIKSAPLVSLWLYATLILYPSLNLCVRFLFFCVRACVRVCVCISFLSCAENTYLPFWFQKVGDVESARRWDSQISYERVCQLA